MAWAWAGPRFQPRGGAGGIGQAEAFSFIRFLSPPLFIIVGGLKKHFAFVASSFLFGHHYLRGELLRPVISSSRAAKNCTDDELISLHFFRFSTVFHGNEATALFLNDFRQSGCGDLVF